MRQISQGLNRPFKKYMFNFIEQQRQNNRPRKAPNDFIQADQQRISKNRIKLRVFEHLAEVL
ncbi:hypothetical protein D3C87_2004800 [compost metagenome]